MIYSLDCFLVNFSGEMPLMYFRLIWSLSIPLIFLILLTIGYFIYCLIFRRQFKVNILVTACLFLFIYFQPNIVYDFISIVSCRTIGKTDYIKANVYFECFTQTHVYYSIFFIIPILILLVFIIPFFLTYKLHSKRSQLKMPSVILKYGFLF